MPNNQENGKNLTKNGKNLTENVKNCTGIFEIFDYRHIFGTLIHVKNVPVYTGKNVPVFPVHFHENVPEFKTLTGMHGLSTTIFFGDQT